MGGHFLTSVLDSIVCKEESFTNMKISHVVPHVDPIHEMKNEILEMYFWGKQPNQMFANLVIPSYLKNNSRNLLTTFGNLFMPAMTHIRT